MQIKLTVLHLMFPSCFCHFSLLSKLAQGNLEQRNYLLEVFQSFQQHFVAFHDVAESSRRYRAHLKLKHFNKSLFFLSSKSQIWTYLSHKCHKDKDRKRIFNLEGEDAKYFVQKGEKHLYSYNKSTSIPYFSQYVA